MPDAPDPTVSQPAPLVAVQEHPDPDVTATIPLLAAAVAEMLVGDTEYVQPVAWVTGNTLPPMVRLAARAGPVFTAAE